MNNITCNCVNCKHHLNKSNFCEFESISINEHGNCVNYIIKPTKCSYCGSDAKVLKTDYQGQLLYFVECSQMKTMLCKAYPRTYCKTEELAIKSWDFFMKYALEHFECCKKESDNND